MSAHRVVIIGGGFGGLHAAQKLGNSKTDVLLLDKRNFHLFQPLLYQVATGGLSPGEIASPLRAILNNYQNVTVLAAEVIDIDPQHNEVILKETPGIRFDSLIVATGSSHHYFGHEEWADVAPGLKTIEQALDIRSRIFAAYETAERENDAGNPARDVTFVIVGGGPTGVEMAGALGELAHHTLRNDFRRIKPENTRILLVEGEDRILPTYSRELSDKAQKMIANLGVTIRLKTRVTQIEKTFVVLHGEQGEERIFQPTVIWAAGVKASSAGGMLKNATGIELDRGGRVIVNDDLSIPGHPNIFVIGDLANYAHQDGKPLPGLAPVAMQQGDYVADLILRRLKGKNTSPFRYRDKGSLAVIGRNAAVAELPRVRLAGAFAWLVWVFVHIHYLIEFDNKLLVLMQWAWNYFTRKRGARLITGEAEIPVAHPDREPATASRT